MRGDGHIRVLPLHVANKIAAGEVVERPASVVKELVENSIDAGAAAIAISVVQGGRKLISVRDDGCGMDRDDAVLCLERQATSKIADTSDIESIDTLGFRGEAIPSIASVSRFTLSTRRRESDEGTLVQVNAGTLAEVRSTGCPPGTLVEVRDLFCNVPARKKFLRSYATEESHIRQIFTTHALAHPEIAFSLSSDGREVKRLAPAGSAKERLAEIFGAEFAERLVPVDGSHDGVSVKGFVERPDLSIPMRRDQYIFVNGRPATAPCVAHAMRDAFPRNGGATRPAAIVFIVLPPSQVDVNVHPTKREVRFRDNSSVRLAVCSAIEKAFSRRSFSLSAAPEPAPSPQPAIPSAARETPAAPAIPHPEPTPPSPVSPPEPAPVAAELPLASDGESAAPWRWFKFLAQSASGYLLIETDAGIVTINPVAARERIAYEKLLGRPDQAQSPSQTLLIPETIQLPPVDAARIEASMDALSGMGFSIERFGHDTFKIDAVPQIASSLDPSSVLATVARDLSESSGRGGGARWRNELVAKSVARSFAGVATTLSPETATKLVEDLCSCKMPYVCPRGKPVMIFTSTRELDRKFDRT